MRASTRVPGLHATAAGGCPWIVAPISIRGKHYSAGASSDDNFSCNFPSTADDNIRVSVHDNCHIRSTADCSTNNTIPSSACAVNNSSGSSTSSTSNDITGNSCPCSAQASSSTFRTCTIAIAYSGASATSTGTRASSASACPGASGSAPARPTKAATSGVVPEGLRRLRHLHLRPASQLRVLPLGSL